MTSVGSLLKKNCNLKILNRRPLVIGQEETSTINKNVFISSAALIFFITLISTLFPNFAQEVFSQVQSWLNQQTSWVYLLSVATILFFSFWLIFSRLGDIKLGPDHSSPEYSNLSWFSMLFSAGMGIGLLFFGVAEPLMHFSAPPVGEPLSFQSAQEAMKITFFHWGLHAWAIYATLSVILAYFSYRKNLPLLPRSIFYPFLGKKVFGPLGDVIDTIAILGTLFGVATSLGFGVTQVNAGLNYLFEVPQNINVQVGLIIFITLLATTSVVLGLDGGIKRLSNLNMILACFLLLFILLLGETSYLMRSFVQNTGAYLSDIVYKTFNLYTYEKKEDWIGGWTLLYWGWWVSWAPFVGMFIARISRGRSIREFMSGVLFIPAGFTFLWMTVFGNSAILIALSKEEHTLVDSALNNTPVAIFKFFEFFPFSSALSLLGLLLIVTFFVSSSDSGSLVIDTLASGGAKEPPVWQRIFWALMEGGVAIALLLAGGLEALQAMTIASAFPMMLLILLGCLAFIKTLREDYLLSTSVSQHNTSVQYVKANTTWKDRLESLTSIPNKKEASKFLEESVLAAFKEVQEELIKKGLSVKVEQGDLFAKLAVLNRGVEDFFYGIYLKPSQTPDFVPEDQELYYRAEVYLFQGGQDYNVFGYTKEQIIADLITQYERHLHYLFLNQPE